MREIVRGGTSLVDVAGGLVQAARQLQKLHLDIAQYARGFIDPTQRQYPEIADELMSIYTLGAIPVYHPLPTKPAPGDGYPHNPK